MSWTALLIGVALVQSACWLALYAGVRRAAPPHSETRAAEAAASSGDLPPLSVVVAARNEAEHLPALLDALLAQSHPSVEIVVVDDASTDATAEIVRRRADAHDALRLVSVETPAFPRKKHALAQGIAAARHDLLAFTDADCRPPPTWCQALAQAHAATEREAVLVGYSPMDAAVEAGSASEGGAGPLLRRLARYETLATGTLTLSSIGLGRPYMAVGRNLSYSKATFERAGGFASGDASLSGDDDLFVQAVARQDAAAVVPLCAPETQVPTALPSSWSGWLRGKRRHASAGRFYALAPALGLTLLHATNAACWLAPLVLGRLGVGLLALKLLLQLPAVGAATERLERDGNLLPLLPLWDLLHLITLAITALPGLVRIPDEW
jgi:cellulose synthase/poly-beta-1,6-N-acetylglucosamine synthase-like glycosyltransferase